MRSEMEPPELDAPLPMNPDMKSPPLKELVIPEVMPAVRPLNTALFRASFAEPPDSRVDTPPTIAPAMGGGTPKNVRAAVPTI